MAFAGAQQTNATNTFPDGAVRCVPLSGMILWMPFGTSTCPTPTHCYAGTVCEPCGSTAAEERDRLGICGAPSRRS
jgi:hypothetical protein